MSTRVPMSSPGPVGSPGPTALELLAEFSCEAAGMVLGPDGVRETRGDVDRERPWRSVTKPLTGLAAVIAVQEGYADLDQPAGPPGATLRHLLAHASGYFYESDNVLMAPGRRRHYSNYAIDEAARVVAAAVGMDFGTWVRQRVAEPLGMRALRWTGSASVGTFAPLTDLARLASELLEPTLLEADMMAQYVGPQFPELVGVMPGFGHQEPNPFGLGIEVRGAKEPHWTGAGNSPQTIGHFGMLGTAFWVDPQASLALVVGTDLEFCDEHRALMPRLSDAVLAAHGARGPKAG